jgi:hypothetical protein
MLAFIALLAIATYWRDGDLIAQHRAAFASSGVMPGPQGQLDVAREATNTSWQPGRRHIPGLEMGLCRSTAQTI